MHSGGGGVEPLRRPPSLSTSCPALAYGWALVVENHAVLSMRKEGPKPRCPYPEGFRRFAGRGPKSRPTRSGSGLGAAGDDGGRGDDRVAGAADVVLEEVRLVADLLGGVAHGIAPAGCWFGN